MTGRRVLSLVALALCLGLASSAAAQHVLTRVSLPVDGRWVDVRAFVPPGDAPVRVALTGTLSSAADGSEIDAMSRWAAGARIDAEGPFVVLPRGSRLLEQDPGIHRYVIEIPRQDDMRVAFDVTPIATRHLMTPTEVRAGLSGAVEMEILAPPLAPAVLALPSPRAETSLLPFAAFAGGAAGAPLLALFGWLFARRRRRRVDERLLRRSRAALRAVERESAPLGPAFGEVAVQARHMLDGALDVQRHFRAARAAERRTRGLRAEGAAARRGELREQQREALTRLRDIAERLEETATQLASHGAGQARTQDLDALLRGLDMEVSTAVSADEEAQRAA